MFDKALAVGILALVYALIVSERVHRTTAVLLGVILVMGLGILSLDDAVQFVNWEALGLIFGMFILVAALTASGFFRWIGLHALRAAKFRPTRVFFLFCGLAALLAAFMDSITVMIFMASLTLEVSRVLRIHPVPFLIGQITSANIGGSATMVGDPPNVIIGTALQFGFADFVANTGPIALAVFAANVGFFYAFLRKTEFRQAATSPEATLADGGEFDPFSAVQDVRLMRIALVVFAFTVTLLVLHQLLDLLVAFVAVLGATLVLMLGGRDMPDLVEKIDWHTLLFLGGLFVIVGGLEKTGFLADVATGLGSVAGGNVALLLTVVIWSAALLSTLLDNIPFTAAMVPIIREVSLVNGVPLPPLAWSLALGADLGGNGTPIGASANVVGLAVAEKEGVHVTWREYMRIAVPATLVAVAIANVLVLLRYA
ncbi:MAG TPA: ArsB/NhaD family transporter [Thermoplasmata archaeon]|nr:ArsB/NhaD family transporter [Thermoplasmata archaeon]